MMKDLTLKEEQKLYKEAAIIAHGFKNNPGITDIEFGLKFKDGELTDNLSLRFRVVEKIPKSRLKISEMIPGQIGNLRTDVLQKHELKQQVRIVQPQDVVRPVIGGVQIQSDLYDSPEFWGTLGCIVNINGRLLGLTNYHVLYGNVNNPMYIQSEYVGKLPVYQNIKGIGKKMGIAAELFSYDLDYATFTIEVPVDQYQSINNIPGIIRSCAIPRINMRVLKSGARTNMTYGIIDARSCISGSDLSIILDSGYPNPDGIISNSGDSGSIWILNENTEFPVPVALHYQGDGLKNARAKSFNSIIASIVNKKTKL